MALGSLPAEWGLARDTKQGWIAGVCAGIAERVGIKPLWVRIAFVLLALVWHGAAAILLYVVLALLMPRGAGPWMGGAGRRSEMFPNTPPPPTDNLSARFAALDARLNRLEAAVTTPEFSLRQKFKDLG
jgi:phage shock protein C